MLKLKSRLKVDKLVVLPNIAEQLDDQDLRKIAGECCKKYLEDKASRMIWETQTRKIVELVSLEHQQKNWPIENASNVKLPVITTANLQLAAKLYQETVRNNKVVYVAVVGQDPTGVKQERARREAQCLNYQLLIKSDTWLTAFDKLTHTIGIVGVCFQKIYYDPILAETVAETIPYTDLVINAHVKDLESARRVTHKLSMHKNDILEKIRAGTFCINDEVVLNDEDIGEENPDNMTVLEQHCYLDLDGDNYEEPYIVTILEKNQEVLRIVARYDMSRVIKNNKDKIQSIKPKIYFVDYHCLPNPDGSYYSLGLGHLLYDLTHSCNTTVNQLIDAGRLANTPTGIATKNFRVKGGKLPLLPGNIAVLDTQLMGTKIEDEIMMLEFREPSPTLFNLLNFLSQKANELATINDVNLGQAEVQNVATNVMSSQIEQGQKVSNSIHKRVFRGLKKAFEKFYEFNSIYLDLQEYSEMLDIPPGLLQNDWDPSGIDVRPIADPELGNETVRLQRLQFMKEAMIDDPNISKVINIYEWAKQVCETMSIANLDHLLLPPNPNAPPPPEVLKLQSDIAAQHDQVQLQMRDQQLKAADVQIRAHLAQAEIAKLMSEATLNASQAHTEQQAPRMAAMENAKDVAVAGMKEQSNIHQTHVKAAVDLEGKKIAAAAKSKTDNTGK